MPLDLLHDFLIQRKATQPLRPGTETRRDATLTILTTLTATTN